MVILEGSGALTPGDAVRFTATGGQSQQVHPGHDWFLVLEGRVRLWLGERQIDVDTGEAAEFATMDPHAISAVDGPAELIMVFDRDGQRAHVHQ